MKIQPVSPIIRGEFSRHFSQKQPTNRRHKMSDNNTDTITISENSEDKDTTVTIPLEFTAKLGVPQELIDEGNRALNRFKWTLITIVGGYVAIVILANIALSS